MSDFDRELFLVAPLAAGLAVFGLLGLVLRAAAASWRLAISGTLVAAVYAVLGLSFVPESTAVYSGSAVAATTACVALVRSRVVRHLLGQLQHPVVSSASLVVLGLLGLLASQIRHESKFQEAIQRDTDVFSRSSVVRDRVEVPEVRATTDRGLPITLSRCRVPRSTDEVGEIERAVQAVDKFGDLAIRRLPASDDCNCHGWVFTGGRYIVSGDAVLKILEDNGYVPVSTGVPGDLVIYRSPGGEVLHTAVVRYAAKGRPPMVEGKWGWMGVYLHAADESAYGTNYTFYRGNRDGDILRGIEGSAAPTRFTGAE